MKIPADQLNIRSFQQAEDAADIRHREPPARKSPASVQPVSVSLSSPVERVMKRAFELYASETSINQERIDKGKHILENWSEIGDKQIDAMLDSLSADLF